MPGLVNRLWRDERGATATEYAMLIIFIALAIAGGATLLGSNIQQSFQQPRREHLGSDALRERIREDQTGEHVIAPTCSRAAALICGGIAQFPVLLSKF